MQAVSVRTCQIRSKRLTCDSEVCRLLRVYDKAGRAGAEKFVGGVTRRMRAEI